MNAFSVFLYPFKPIIGTKKTNKKHGQKKCNTFKAALRSEHRCREQRREIHTINISNKMWNLLEFYFIYTSTDIPVVLLLVKYVPQYIYMERYGPQELSWERLNILGANEVSSKIARPTLKGVSISINGLLACSNLRNPVPFVNPLSPDINICPHISIFVCCPHFSYDTTWENLFKHQDIPSLVIISFILVSCMFDQSVIL